MPRRRFDYDIVCLHEHFCCSLKLYFRSYRFAGYKQYIWWIYNILGKGVRNVIPSCAVWAIRYSFPEPSGVYIQFQEYKQDERITAESD